MGELDKQGRFVYGRKKTDKGMTHENGYSQVLGYKSNIKI